MLDLVLQIIPVMIGVFLAFLVSDCSEARKRARDTRQMASFLYAELQENKTRIEATTDYHQMLVDSTRYYQGKSINASDIKFFKGLNPVNLSTSSYESAVQTGLISEMNLEEVRAINQIYDRQESYNEFNRMMLSGLMNMDFSNPDEVQRILRYVSIAMYDATLKEADLLKQYPTVLERLEQE